MAHGGTDSALKASSDLHRTIAWMDVALASLKEAVILIDADRQTILFANDSLARLTGRERIFLLGQKIESVLPPASRHDGAQEPELPWSIAGQKSEKTPREYIAQTAQGLRFLEISTTAFDWVNTDRRKVRHLVLILKDVTERHQAEEALAYQTQKLKRSNAELEEFAYVASHDLQEPLRKVKSYCQLLEKRYRDRLDTDANEFIHIAVDGAARMQAMIDDLLTYARVDREEEPTGSTDCRAAYDRVISNLQTVIQESQAEVTCGELPAVWMGGLQIEELLQNLISNAIKYRGNRPPIVHISAKKWTGQWLFCVQDNGIGIDPQYHERIFAIFKRLHSRNEYPGTGIGLAICKKIVERHGGRIWVESQVGQGAKFYFTLPTRGVNPT